MTVFEYAATMYDAVRCTGVDGFMDRYISMQFLDCRLRQTVRGFWCRDRDEKTLKRCKTQFTDVVHAPHLCRMK